MRTDKVLLRPLTAPARETRALFGTQVPSVAQRGWDWCACVICVPKVCACSAARHGVSRRGMVGDREGERGMDLKARLHTDMP